MFYYRILPIYFLKKIGLLVNMSEILPKSQNWPAYVFFLIYEEFWFKSSSGGREIALEMLVLDRYFAKIFAPTARFLLNCIS